MAAPVWVDKALGYLGQREIKGVTHNPLIVSWWKAILRGGIKTDEVPWCAAFVGAMLESVGIKSSRFESAKSYMLWGTRLPEPTLGCVVVFERDGGGHVGFVVGQDKHNNLLVLGGNQSDMVSIAAFPRARAVAYRWPVAVPVNYAALPVGAAGISQSEA